MPDSLEGQLNLGNGRPRLRGREALAPTPPSPDKLNWTLRQVQFVKMSRLMRDLRKAYVLGYSLAYDPTISSHEPTTGGGDSDSTGEIVADEHREDVRARLHQAHSLSVSAVKKIYEAWDELNEAKNLAERSAGMRVRSWDAAEMRAVEARRERRRFGDLPPTATRREVAESQARASRRGDG